MRSINQQVRHFAQHAVSKHQKYVQKSESILGLILRAWDRMPALLQLDEWKAGDCILVNNQYVGRMDAFAIVNNNKYAWVEVQVGKQVQHFGIKLTDIRRIENA